MGIETYLLYGAIAGATAATVLAPKAGKPHFPTLTPLKAPSAGVRTKVEEERAKAYLASRAKRAESRRKTRITPPGFLDQTQVARPTLSNVLG